MTERSGSMFLTAGSHAIRLSWCNSAEPHGLEVYYQGPDLPRQKIPEAVLWIKLQINDGLHVIVSASVPTTFYRLSLWTPSCFLSPMLSPRGVDKGGDNSRSSQGHGRESGF